MEILHHEGYTGKKPGTALALGYFDGVHVGHKAVVDRARQKAGQDGLATGVFTFTMNGEGPKGKRIQSLSQKHDQLARLGVEYCFEPKFKSFHNLPPQEFFMQKLLKEYKAKAIYCGEDFFFGANRAGDAGLLRRLCEQNGVGFATVPMAYYKDELVSSSRIRTALEQGDLVSANAMLGRPYEIDFPVKHGNRIGSAHGFPTINQIFPEEMQMPRFGVYISQVVVEGTVYPAATGLGNRPTVNGENPTCETFIPGYSGDLYGKSIQVRFFKYLSESKKFKDTDALAKAVHQWAKQALAFFAG